MNKQQALFFALLPSLEAPEKGLDLCAPEKGLDLCAPEKGLDCSASILIKRQD